jgi:hypothetical protein
VEFKDTAAIVLSRASSGSSTNFRISVNRWFPFRLRRGSSSPVSLLHGFQPSSSIYSPPCVAPPPLRTPAPAARLHALARACMAPAGAALSPCLPLLARAMVAEPHKSSGAGPQSRRAAPAPGSTTSASEREIGLNLFLNKFWWLNCPTQIIGLTSLL